MIIEPKKNYKQTVKRPYKVTHAVLDQKTSVKGNVDLMLNITGATGHFIAASLSSNTPQVALNLEFAKGDQIAFSTRGEGAVHLTGYIMEAFPEASANGKAEKKTSQQKHKDLQKLLEKTMSDEDSDDMDYSALLEDYDGLGDSEDDGEEGEEEEGGDEEGEDSDDDQEGEEDSDDDEMGDDDSEDDGEEEEEESDEEEVAPPPSKKNKKEQAKQPEPKKKDAKPEQKKKEEPAKTNGAAESKTGKMVTLSSGVKVKDTKEGTGAFAKPGKNVVVYYEGRVQGKNQIFDSCKQGSGFKFMLGRGTVIKAWDIGVSIWIYRILIEVALE